MYLEIEEKKVGANDISNDSETEIEEEGGQKKKTTNFSVGSEEDVHTFDR